MAAIWHHTSKMGRYFKENISSNFYHDKNLLKIKLRGGKRRLSQNKSENGKMTGIWRHTSKTGHDMKEEFFSRCSSDEAEHLYRDKHPLKIKLNCLKKGLGQKITKTRQNYGYNDVIRPKRDMIRRRCFFQNISLIILNTFTVNNIAWKSSYSA